MVTTKKWVIGGGISGLVFQFYHPDFTIITPEVGGMYNKTYMVWLHDQPETRKLLTDLGLEVKPKRSYIGYYSNGWILENKTKEMNISMIQKKMSPWNEKIDSSFVPPSLDMSTVPTFGPSYLNSLDTDLSEIIRRLEERSVVQNGLVTKISSTHIQVLDQQTKQQEDVEYSELVTTIPAPHFWKAWGEPRDFKFYPITNIITQDKPKAYDDKFEMVYYDSSVPYSRVSHLSGRYAYEFTGILPREDVEKVLPNVSVEDYVVVRQGRIFESGPNDPPKPNVFFLGRFATWKYGTTTEHVIKQSLEYEFKN